jgi:hypothetical protein
VQAEGQVRDDAGRAGVLAVAPRLVPQIGRLRPQAPPDGFVLRGQPAEEAN